jgi:hypothetical protein
MTYLRFVTDWPSDEGFRVCGLLAAATEIRDQLHFSGPDFSALCDHLDWFTEHLEVPPMFDDPSVGRTESWFFANALEHVRRAVDLAEFIERRFLVKTSVLCRDELQGVLYEDSFQLLVIASVAPGK